MLPLVSVIIPSYNHGKFLKARIDSILNQSFQNFELIILDDLSPDNSREIIETYREHPKISHIIYNEINSGSTFAQWNNAIFNYAQGKYIWIAESDDVAELTLLQVLISKLESNSHIIAAYTQSARLSATDEVTGNWLSHTETLKHAQKFNTSYSMNGLEYICKYLIYKNTLPNASAVVFRRDAYLLVGGAKTELKTNGDWDLWLKLIVQGEVYYHREELNYFRYHDSSVIAKARNSGGKVGLRLRMCEYDLMLRISINEFLDTLDKKSVKKISMLNNKIMNKDRFTIFILSKLKVLFK